MPSSSPSRHSVGVGHFRFRIELVALFERRPQPPVAHDDGIDHAIAVEGQTGPGSARPAFSEASSPSARFLLARQQLHKRGFAGAVRSGQAIALARRKAGGDFVKQNFGAVAHGDVAN